MADERPGSATLAELDPDAARAAVLRELADSPGLRLLPDEPMDRHLPLRCGGPADLWVEARDLEALRAAWRAARRHGMTTHLCWPLQELLVRDGGVRGMVIRPGPGFEGVDPLPPTEALGARIRLGAAAPWSAALRHAPALEPGPALVVGTWPGCPGALFEQGPHEALEGVVAAYEWARGREQERVELSAGAQPAPLPKGAALLAVEVPLAWPGGSRRLRHRVRPPPTGTLFAEDGLPNAPQLHAAGLLGARLRSWRLSIVEPGTLVHLGGGDCSSALLFARGVAEHALKARGVRLETRIPVLGVDGGRRPRPPTPRPRPSEES